MKIKSGIYFLVAIAMLLMLESSCSKKNATNDPIPSETVTDIDGNVYHTVKIGTQTWMVENLKVTKYRNGDPVPNVSGEVAWAALTNGAYCWYNNDDVNKATYGGLYNWYAVADSRNIAPSGWHVPTDSEWTTLENHIAANIGNSVNVAKAMAAKSNWASSNEVGGVGNDLTINNSSGFIALPGGNREYDGKYYYISRQLGWWTSTDTKTSYAWNRYMSSNFHDVVRDFFFKQNGFSVRCVKD